MSLNRLFCTFVSTEEDIDVYLKTLRIRGIVGKMYVLESLDSHEYVITYNSSDKNTFNSTVMVHRKRGFNTLYSINALNLLIQSLNGGILDEFYNINWKDYQNSIMLVKGGELNITKTKLLRIVFDPLALELS
jgi:hypothetical protein